MNRERVIAILSVIVAVLAALWFQIDVPRVQTPSPPPEVAPAAPTAQVHLTAEQDHARILKLLKLPALRPGVHDDSANADEARANPYPDLPDPLKLIDGKPVTTAAMWWQQRRQEIADTVEIEVYGQLQPGVELVWTEVPGAPEQLGSIAAVTRHFVGTASSVQPRIEVSASLTVTLPANAKGPVPVILLLSSPRFEAQAATWREQVLAKGWGAAVLDVTSLQPDNGADLTGGIIGIASKGQPRGLPDWGVLRAWAWGASRAIDFFERDPKVDAAQIGIAGHSRYGKAALIAMAYDARFVVAYISSSGAGGAALLRRHFGEQIENLASTGEYHWFAGNFLKYSGRLTAKDLPVDAHDLFALAAPRPVFVSAGSNGDNWVDPRGMFMAEAAATPVYKLLGKTGLSSTTMPPAGVAVDGGELAFRQHDQGHTMDPNWPSFLTFASRYIHTKG